MVAEVVPVFKLHVDFARLGPTSIALHEKLEKAHLSILDKRSLENGLEQVNVAVTHLDRLKSSQSAFENNCGLVLA